MRIKFDFLSDGGNNIYIDDINLGGFSSIENSFEEHALQLFPNPVTDHLILKLNLQHDIEGSIKLYDVTGRMLEVIYSGKIKKDRNISVDVSRFSSQVYFIQLENNGAKQIYRFVKQD